MITTTERIPLTALLETQSRSKIARKLGVEPSTVTRWARGETLPDARRLIDLARLLHVSLDLIDLGPAK